MTHADVHAEDAAKSKDNLDFWERMTLNTGIRNWLIGTSMLVTPTFLDGAADRYAKAADMFELANSLPMPESLLANGVAVGFLALNIIQATAIGMWANAAATYFMGKGKGAEEAKDPVVAFKAPAKVMEQSLELAQGLTNDPAKLDRMLENCRELIAEGREGAGVYFVFDPANPDDQAVLSAEQFADFKRRVDATDKTLVSMTWEKKGDVDIQTKMITVGGKRDSSLIGNLPAVQKFEWEEGAETGRLASQGWFKDNRMVMPIQLVLGSDLKEDMSKNMGDLPSSAVFRKENFAHATGVLVERLPEGSPVNEAGLTHRVFAGEQGGGFIELGFATDAEVATLKKALEPTDIFLNEPGKPTMQRGEPLTEEREKTLGLGL